MDAGRLFQDVDLYCERLGPGFWAEPLNALSNAAFFVAAFLLFRLYRQCFDAAKLPDLQRLVRLIVVVGVGSTIFHTLATQWAMAADVLPIVLFLLWYLAVFLTRVVRVRYKGLAVGFGAFGAVSGAFMLLVPPALVNGSQTYFSCFVALVCMGIYAQKHRHAETKNYYVAAVAFLVSLIARMVDQSICYGLPIGTHFVWHTLNAVTMYFACRAIFLHVQKKTPRQAAGSGGFLESVG